MTDEEGLSGSCPTRTWHYQSSPCSLSTIPIMIIYAVPQYLSPSHTLKRLPPRTFFAVSDTTSPPFLPCPPLPPDKTPSLVATSRLMYEFCAVLIEDDKPIGNVSKKTCVHTDIFQLRCPGLPGNSRSSNLTDSSQLFRFGEIFTFYKREDKAPGTYALPLPPLYMTCACIHIIE